MSSIPMNAYRELLTAAARLRAHDSLKTRLSALALGERLWPGFTKTLKRVRDASTTEDGLDSFINNINVEIVFALLIVAHVSHTDSATIDTLMSVLMSKTHEDSGLDAETFFELILVDREAVATAMAHYNKHKESKDEQA